MSEILVNTIKKADGTGSLTIPADTGTVVIKDGSNDVTLNNITATGVYLGGTGAANYLDDYEEGSGTPTVSMTGGGSVTITNGNYEYTKIGNVCHFSFEFQTTGVSSPSGTVRVDVPFATPSQVFAAGSLRVYNNTFSGSPFIEVASNDSHLIFSTNISGSATGSIVPDAGSGHYFFGQITYRTV